MEKEILKGSAMLAPVPAVIVSCGDEEKSNLITIGWTGIVNSQPPMTYISVRKERYSHYIIEETGEFVINLTTEKMAHATDWCGVRSGRDYDKFKETGLTPGKCEVVKCPLISESPVNLECVVREKRELGSHDMFLAEIVRVHASKDIFDDKGRIRLDRAGMLAYCHGEYFGLKRQALGRFGFSVMKPKTRKRLAKQKNRGSEGKKAPRHSKSGKKPKKEKH